MYLLSVKNFRESDNQMDYNLQIEHTNTTKNDAITLWQQMTVW